MTKASKDPVKPENPQAFRTPRKPAGGSEAALAELLGVNQPKVSALQNYKLDGFSVERLMTFLMGLGSDIEIRIRKPKRAADRIGRILIEVA